MRQDMMKVLTERPRRGSWARYHDLGVRSAWRRDPEAAPLREPIGRGGFKEFDDLLGPLKRLLSSRVGRSWDRVYSEICAELRTRGTLQAHVLQHLRQLVERDALVVAKHACRCGRHTGQADHCYGRFFVCLRTGRLEARASRRYRKPQDPPQPRPLHLGGSEWAMLLDGHWYAVRFARWPEELDGVWDKLERRPLVELPPREWYAAGKRQLSRRELGQLG